jgi:hypothetical protein
MTRINGGGGLAAKNPFGPTWVQGKQPESLREQVENELFRRKPPPLVEDESLEPELQRCRAVVRRLTRMAGDDEDSTRVVLADGTIAMIDQSGTIMLGQAFVRSLPLHEKDGWATLVGVLAHEVGHRPARWATYRSEQMRSRAELQELCRLEETRADWFAGAALATLQLPFEPVCALLMSLDDPRGQGSHDYFPSRVRCDVIREAHDDASRKHKQRRSFFPELDKQRGGRFDLGEG